jgi:hypothetical protein
LIFQDFHGGLHQIQHMDAHKLALTVILLCLEWPSQQKGGEKGNLGLVLRRCRS